MATPSEDRLVTWLKSQLNTELDFIVKIYSDRPRQDVKNADFPRLRVKEISSVSRKVGIGQHSKKYYDVLLMITFWVDVDGGMTTIDGVEYSPERAVSKGCWVIKKNIEDNEQVIANNNDQDFLLQSSDYSEGGSDNEYFKKLNAYKGFVECRFDLFY